MQLKMVAGGGLEIHPAGPLRATKTRSIDTRYVFFFLLAPAAGWEGTWGLALEPWPLGHVLARCRMWHSAIQIGGTKYDSSESGNDSFGPPQCRDGKL